MFRIFYKAVLMTLILLTVYSGNTNAQIDSAAVAILDNMSDIVTNLESCSFVLKTEYDIYSNLLGLVKHSDAATVFLKAPDKLMVSRKGDKGDKYFYCDGKTLTYYSADNNQYSVVPAFSTIMETIDSINSEYGIEFPAADIFYPDLVDELIERSDNISYLGFTMIEDKVCFHIAGTTENVTYQVWINKDDYLPSKMAIVYKNNTGNPQYEALFLKWDLNPVLEDSMFDFVAPQGAVKVIFKKKI